MSENRAYDFSLFEEHEKQNERKETNKTIKLDEEQLLKNQRIKYKPAAVIGMICLALITVAVISSSIVGQVRLTELTSEINALEAQYEESKSVYTQLEMQVETKLSLDKIEEYTTQQLNMDQLKNSQITYVNLSDGDAVLVKSEPDAIWIAAIKEAISNFMS
ncbi:MAG: hypothetical protein Q4B14_01550 [Clostridia bacterium]|nr:hypothetical protein [Clostridia bacterium]